MFVLVLTCQLIYSAGITLLRPEQIAVMENVRIGWSGLWSWEFADDLDLKQGLHGRMLEAKRGEAEGHPEPVITETAADPLSHRR